MNVENCSDQNLRHFGTVDDKQAILDTGTPEYPGTALAL